MTNLYQLKTNFSTSSCPECCAVCTVNSTVRLYLTMSMKSPEEEALYHVQWDITRARKQLAFNETKIKYIRKKISAAEIDEKTLQSDIDKLKEETNEKLREMSRLKEKIVKQQDVQKKLMEAESWERMQKVWTGATSEVEKMMESEKSRRHLAKMIVLLRQ